MHTQCHIRFIKSHSKVALREVSTMLKSCLLLNVHLSIIMTVSETVAVKRHRVPAQRHCGVLFCSEHIARWAFSTLSGHFARQPQKLDF